MQTNLELLKSIHENGGGLSNCCPKGQTKSYRDMTDEQLSHLGWFRANDGEIYRTPSELEVEKKIVELSGKDYDLCIRRRKHTGEWQYGIWNGMYINDFKEDKGKPISHESRLTAGLMLWDKLQKEKKNE